MIEPANLAEANIVYRRPEVVAELGTSVATVLDLGCGTGRDLAIFQNRYGWSGVGVDVQPQMIDYARDTHPGLDLRVGDLRDLNLETGFDLIACLGNSLAYLHTDHDLSAAAVTISRHANPGALLVINTLTTPPPEASDSSCRVEAGAIGATVTINSRWNPATRLHITERAWKFDHDESAVDRLVRRVIPRHELDSILATAAGWESLGADDSPFAVYRATHPACCSRGRLQATRLFTRCGREGSAITPSDAVGLWALNHANTDSHVIFSDHTGGQTTLGQLGQP